jgi:type I restriction enzyme S subunit
MNRSQLLSDHFATLAETPDAVAKLRNFALHLGTRGILVPQKSTDEPAVELVKRITALGERIAKEQKIKLPAPEAAITEADQKFPLPKGWAWVKLGDLCAKLGAGSTPLGGKRVYQKAGVKFLRSQNVWNEGLYLDDVALIDPAVHKDMDSTCVEPGDVLLNITGASIGRCAVVPDDFDEANVSQHVAIVRLTDKVLRQFIHLIIIAPDFQSQIMQVQVGVSREGLSMKNLKEFVVALPPLAEQRRIVAKVAELLALCDELEAAQTAAREHRIHLVRSALDHLTTAQTEPEFRHHATFVLQHSDLILDSVSTLRQAILSLAVQGHIAANAKTWPEEPESVGEFAPMQNGYAFQSEWFVPKGVRLLRNKNVSHGVMRWDDMECIVENRLKEFERFRLDEGDVVLSLDRPFISTGIKVARVRREDLPCLLLQRVGRFQPDAKRLHPDYLFLFLNSPHFASQIDPGRSNGVPHISSKQVEAAKIFVPPLAEQQRIVAKVDELMRWCDALEARLTAAQTTAAQLLDATLHQILAA